MYPAQVWTSPPGYPHLDVRQFHTPANDPHGPGPKPFGGLWTSSYHPGHLSDWACDEACHSREGDWLKAWVLRAPRAKLWVIDRYEDLERLVDQYPRPPCPCGACGIWGDLATAAGVSLGQVMNSMQHPMDVEAMEADGWDGIWLTERGRGECHLPLGRGPYSLNLYGWDVECTYWLRWPFTEVRYLGIFPSPERQRSEQERAAELLLEHADHGGFDERPGGLVCEADDTLVIPRWMLDQAASRG